MRSTWFASLLLVGLLIVFRVISAFGLLPNFSPLPAVFLCSLIFFRKKSAWLLPVVAWMVTDPLVSLIQGYPLIGFQHLGILAGLSGCVGLGLWLRRHPSRGAVLGGSLLAAAFFYVASNSVAFLFDPLYSKTFHGFVQAQWTGPEGYAPTWLFFRNLAAANFLFTAAFLSALSPAARFTNPATLPTATHS
ncbi:hypothetical protein Hsar01_01838 [Haloferula sargassicola]|uniref:ECF transporter S component n=2 Tax=Haloferula sargassicola TaxID=490096 RepID=A0ABP9UM47_9BACT